MIWITSILIIAPLIVFGEKKQPNFSPNIGDISTQLYVELSNDTKVYKLSNVSEMLNDSRRNFLMNFDLAFSSAQKWERSLVCYMTSLTYRTAVWDLYRYFHVRDLYADNLEFEIGYLTQEVIYHYEVILEIYQMIDKRYIKNIDKNYAPVSYIFFLYGNILEKSKIIIHLCNMMHELENKYVFSKNTGPFAEEKKKKKNATGRGFEDNSLTSASGMNVDLLRIEHMRKEAIKAKQQRILQKQRNKYNKRMKKFGLTTRTKKRIKKKSMWPIEYGWSIEDW